MSLCAADTMNKNIFLLQYDTLRFSPDTDLYMLFNKWQSEPVNEALFVNLNAVFKSTTVV